MCHLNITISSRKTIILFILCEQLLFKRLFSSHQIQKTFDECKIDSTHDLIVTKKVVDLALRYLTPLESRSNIHININIQNNANNNINININNKEQKNRLQKKNQFLQYYQKKLNSHSMVQKIKTLIVGHAILRKVCDEDFVQFFVEQIDKEICGNPEEKSEGTKENKKEVEIKLENTKQDFMQKNIISFYCFYLKKLILNMDTYNFAKGCATNSKTVIQDIIEAINHGFIVINLVNYILKSQYTFNKMGRYYINHKELLNLFMKYLEDLLIYNSFIKKLTNLSLSQIKEAGNQELKHHFLFVTQAQKTSDRLYEFFYNRYYYSEIKNMIMMPTFLTINSEEEYKQIVNHVRKRNKELVILVDNSKFESSHSRSKSCVSKTMNTEERQNLSKTQHTEGFSNLTMNQSLGQLPSQIMENTYQAQSCVERKRHKSTYKGW